MGMRTHLYLSVSFIEFPCLAIESAWRCQKSTSPQQMKLPLMKPHLSSLPYLKTDNHVFKWVFCCCESNIWCILCSFCVSYWRRSPAFTVNSRRSLTLTPEASSTLSSLGGSENLIRLVSHSCIKICSTLLYATSSLVAASLLPNLSCKGIF